MMISVERAATTALVTCSPQEAADQLATHPEYGLDADEVARRRAAHGENALAKDEEEGAAPARRDGTPSTRRTDARARDDASDDGRTARVARHRSRRPETG